MNARLIAASILLVVAGAAQAQTVEPAPIPGMPCLDGSDPNITGVPCIPVIHRNAIDEGRASSVLPKRSEIRVPNDPLGRAIGNGAPDIGQVTPFGNPAVQLPKIR